MPVYFWIPSRSALTLESSRWLESARIPQTSHLKRDCPSVLPVYSIPSRGARLLESARELKSALQLEKIRYLGIGKRGNNARQFTVLKISFERSHRDGILRVPSLWRKKALFVKIWDIFGVEKRQASGKNGTFPIPWGMSQLGPRRSFPFRQKTRYHQNFLRKPV